MVYLGPKLQNGSVYGPPGCNPALRLRNPRPVYPTVGAKRLIQDGGLHSRSFTRLLLLDEGFATSGNLVHLVSWRTIVLFRTDPPLLVMDGCTAQIPDRTLRLGRALGELLRRTLARVIPKRRLGCRLTDSGHTGR